MSCDDISADWAAQRIKGLDLGAAIRDGVKRSLGLHRPAAGDGAVIKTLIESFRYPRRGPGMMWDAAAAAIRGNGGRSCSTGGSTACPYDAATKLWTVSARRGDGSRETFTARNVVSSRRSALVGAIRPAPLAPSRPAPCATATSSPWR